MLKGIAASQGIAIAKVYKLEQPVLKIVQTSANPEEELKKSHQRHWQKKNQLFLMRTL